jgi:cyanophycinase
MVSTPGSLILLGGAAIGAAPDLDREVIERLSSTEILMVPTAAAYGHPERDLLQAAQALEPYGVAVEGLMVLTHTDAKAPEMADRVRNAQVIWLLPGSSLHLKSVLKGTAVYDALIAAFAGGATIVASGAGAMALSDPMVDPRGGALTVGLGLMTELAVVAHLDHDQDDPEGLKLQRTVQMAPEEVLVLGLANDAGVIVEADGSIERIGTGRVEAFQGGAPVEGWTTS